MFELVYKYFKTVANGNEVTMWKSKGLFYVSIKPPSASHNSLNLRINYIDNAVKRRVKVILTHKQLANFVFG